jgi:hypothetical protein
VHAAVGRTQSIRARARACAAVRACACARVCDLREGLRLGREAAPAQEPAACARAYACGGTGFATLYAGG